MTRASIAALAELIGVAIGMLIEALIERKSR